MNRVNLLILLDVLKDMRHKMLEEFNDSNTIDIYEPCFEYEDFPKELSLSIEKYFVLWLDRHYSRFSDRLCAQNIPDRNPQDIEMIEIAFLNMQHNLVSLFIDNSFRSDFSRELLRVKKFELSGFLEVSNRHLANISHLQYQQKKHRNLFRRELNRLKNERLVNKGDEQLNV